MPKSFKGYRCLSILNYLPKLSTRTAPDTTLINHKSAITSQSKKTISFSTTSTTSPYPTSPWPTKGCWKILSVFQYCPLNTQGTRKLQLCATLRMMKVTITRLLLPFQQQFSTTTSIWGESIAHQILQCDSSNPQIFSTALTCRDKCIYTIQGN